MLTPIHTEPSATGTEEKLPEQVRIHVNSVEDVAATPDENGVEFTIAVPQFDEPIHIVFTEPEPVVALICILIHDYLKHFPGQTDTITLVREVLRVLDNPEDA